jgi:hypothetical protein
MDRHAHPAADRRSRHADLPRLLRQYLEMVVAMWVGMLVLGTMVRGALAIAGLAYSHGRYPELAALEMTTTMAGGWPPGCATAGTGGRTHWRCAGPCSHPP